MENDYTYTNKSTIIFKVPIKDPLSFNKCVLEIQVNDIRNTSSRCMYVTFSRDWKEHGNSTCELSKK